MRKIIINGFPHCGTTILRRIIGDHPDVFDVEAEMYDFPDMTGDHGLYKNTAVKPYIVCKFVGLPIQLYPYDVTRIWIIKNPWDVFGSFVRRFGNQWKAMPNYQLVDYLHFAERWTMEDLDGHELTIRYEDLFKADRVHWWGSCGLDITKKPEARKAEMGSRAEVPPEEPPRHMSMDFRTWQINQPLEDKTYHSAPWCPLEVLKRLGDYPIIQDAGYKMIQVEGLWFPVGVTLTSLENGQLVMASKDTPPEEIVGNTTKDGFKTWKI